MNEIDLSIFEPDEQETRALGVGVSLIVDAYRQMGADNLEIAKAVKSAFIGGIFDPPSDDGLVRNAGIFRFIFDRCGVDLSGEIMFKFWADKVVELLDEALARESPVYEMEQAHFGDRDTFISGMRPVGEARNS